MKIDAHIHYNSIRRELLEYGLAKDIRFLSIITDMPKFPSIEDQLRIVTDLKKEYGDQLSFAMSFSCKDWGAGKWLNATLDTIKKGVDLGAVGVKFWKNIGMAITDAKDRYVMIDHASFEPIFSYLEEHGIVALGHNGEPRNCWLPMDEMTVASDRRYFSANPEYYMYLHPEVPGYKQQLNARDLVLNRHPKLKFVGLHLASLEWNVDEVATWLDQHPTAMVDLAERICHLQHQTLTHWQRVHDFFVKYQDRIIYGTDFIVHNTEKDLALASYLDHRYQQDWDFFAKDNYMTKPEVTGRFKGLGLPQNVLQKIFHTNAKNTYNL